MYFFTKIMYYINDTYTSDVPIIAKSPTSVRKI